MKNINYVIDKMMYRIQINEKVKRKNPERFRIQDFGKISWTNRLKF